MQTIYQLLNDHWKSNKYVQPSMRIGTHRPSAISTRNMLFTLTMPSVTIRSQANGSSAEAICRPCGVIILVSRQASMSGVSLEKAISGSRNTRSSTRGGQHSQLALWSSAMARSCTRHSISQTPSMRRPGEANGFRLRPSIHNSKTVITFLFRLLAVILAALIGASITVA